MRKKRTRRQKAQEGSTTAKSTPREPLVKTKSSKQKDGKTEVLPETEARHSKAEIKLGRN